VFSLNPGVGVQLLSVEAEILRVHEALEQLAAMNEGLVSVVEMRYVGGMKKEEISELPGLTPRTVRRDWDKARIILIAD